MNQKISIHTSTKEFTLAVAIDFGTTRSGFIYSFLDAGADEISVKDIYNFDNWGKIHNMSLSSYAKDRTEVIYENKKLVDWGWGTRRPGMSTKGTLTLLKLFKLKLQETDEVFTENGIRYNIVEVIADYLRVMKDTSLNIIHGGLSEKIPDKRILWCLTVPAIWNDLAIDRMRRASVKANIIKDDEKETRLLFVKEPEAAAVHCYFNLLNKTLSVGETFMIIDAGGGTIDLTSYKVSYNLKLEEITKSTGGNDGSSFVDHNFMLYLASLGLELDTVKKDDELLDLQIKWEDVKHAITSNELSYSVQLRYKYFCQYHSNFIEKLSKEQNGIDDEVVLTPTLIKELFDPSDSGPYKDLFYPVFAGVKKDIQSHINDLNENKISNVSYIFLVGGFNGSPLLREFIINNFKHFVGNDISRFVAPPRPEQAIMEGACIYAINPSIIHSRISKLTYGLSHSVPFDPSVHAGRRHGIHEGIDYCHDLFYMMCEKGQSIEYNQCIKMTYTVIEKNQSVIPIQVYCSDNKYPVYIDEKGVKKLAEVDVPMPGYGLGREVEVRLYFGKVEIQVEAENLQNHEVKKLSVKFSSSFG